MRTANKTLARFMAAAIAATSVGIVAAPAVDAKPAKYGFYDAKGNYHAYQTKAACERARQRASNQGAVVGGLGGAVLGSAVAGHGAKTEGAVLGGVAGVLAGRQIAKKDHRC